MPLSTIKQILKSVKISWKLIFAYTTIVLKVASLYYMIPCWRIPHSVTQHTIIILPYKIQQYITNTSMYKFIKSECTLPIHNQCDARLVSELLKLIMPSPIVVKINENNMSSLIKSIHYDARSGRYTIKMALNRP